MFILIARYKFDLKDFQKFIKWDKYKYTRNAGTWCTRVTPSLT